MRSGQPKSQRARKLSKTVANKSQINRLFWLCVRSLKEMGYGRSIEMSDWGFGRRNLERMIALPPMIQTRPAKTSTAIPTNCLGSSIDR
jgi:hypothetical protein